MTADWRIVGLVDGWMGARAVYKRCAMAERRPLIRPAGTFSPDGEKARVVWFWCYKDVAPTALGRAAGGKVPLHFAAGMGGDRSV